VRIDQDQSGMLAVHLPGRSTHALHVGFHSVQSDNSLCVKEKASTVLPNKELQQEAVVAKQECELVIREVLYPSPGVNVTSIRENFLQLSLGPEVAFIVCLLPSSSGQGDLKDNDHSIEPDLEMINRDLMIWL
jgi:mediator of RNA polymerase II transcription subunit 17